MSDVDEPSASWAVVTRLRPRGSRRINLFRFLLRVGTQDFLEIASTQTIVLILDRREAESLRLILMKRTTNPSVLSNSTATEENQPNLCAKMQRLAAPDTSSGLIYNLSSEVIAFRVVHLLHFLRLDRSAAVLLPDKHIYWIMDDESWRELQQVMDETLHPDKSTVAELVLQDLNAFVN